MVVVAQTHSFEAGTHAWLTKAFRALVGYVVATDVLATGSAAKSFRSHRRGAAIGRVSPWRGCNRADDGRQSYDCNRFKMGAAHHSLGLGVSIGALLCRKKTGARLHGGRE